MTTVTRIDLGSLKTQYGLYDNTEVFRLEFEMSQDAWFLEAQMEYDPRIVALII